MPVHLCMYIHGHAKQLFQKQLTQEHFFFSAIPTRPSVIQVEHLSSSIMGQSPQ